jgi:hypothetical protein
MILIADVVIISTGPYVITWNFRRVKQGKLYDYQIKQYGENVVADNFKYGQDRNIIVALPDDVQMASKRSLLTPKKALQTPAEVSCIIFVLSMIYHILKSMNRLEHPSRTLSMLHINCST